MAPGKAEIVRFMIVLVSILGACTFPPFAKNTPAPEPEIAIPESPVLEIPSTRRDIRTRRAWPKPAPKTPEVEDELINPLADCASITIDDPKEAARAKLDCMKERLDIQ